MSDNCRAPQSHLTAFVRTVRATMNANRMVEHNDHVVVAVSGGADSVALLYALLDLAPQFGLRLTVAHLNHGLRGDAARHEAEFVEKLSRRLDLPCVSEVRDVRAVKITHGQCMQEAARTVRYRFFNDVLQRCGAQKLALGHTMDDQAETVLIRLLRGASTRGLGGIPPVRGRAIVRPLINNRRVDVERFLKKRGIAFVPDTSANEKQYLRNRIRHELLPLLEQYYNPRVIEALSTTAALARDDEAVLQNTTAIAIHGHIKDDGGRVCIPVNALTDHPHLAGRIVRRAFETLSGSCRRLTSAHVEAVMALTGCTGSSKQVPLPGGLIARREYDDLLLSHTRDPAEGFQVTVDQLPADIVLPHSGIRVQIVRDSTADPAAVRSSTTRDTRHLSAESISMPIVIRSFKPGDRIRPLGFNATKKVNALFADMKIPVRLRRRIPLIESGGQILCVGSLRIAEHCRVTPDSNGVIAVTVTMPEGSE